MISFSWEKKYTKYIVNGKENLENYKSYAYTLFLKESFILRKKKEDILSMIRRNWMEKKYEGSIIDAIN